MRWIEMELKAFSQQTANRYMSLASNCSHVSNSETPNLRQAYIKLGIIDDRIEQPATPKQIESASVLPQLEQPTIDVEVVKENNFERAKKIAAQLIEAMKLLTDDESAEIIQSLYA